MLRGVREHGADRGGLLGDSSLLQDLGFAPGSFGVSGIFTGAALVFFAFIGFDVVATAAEETRNPRRALPRGILGSLAICTTLYIAVALVVTGMVEVQQVDHQRPAGRGIQARSGQPGFATLISLRRR